MSDLELAVVIVNWNVRDLLIPCLESVYDALRTANLRSTVWVVDNASDDGSAEAVATHFPTTRLIASPVNLGFAGGNNLALRAMGFEVAVPTDSAPLIANRTAGPPPSYVLFLNPDTLVHANAPVEMLRFMKQTPHAGVCGPALVYGDGRFQHSAYRFPSLTQLLLDFWPLNWRLTESALNGRYPRRLYEKGEPFLIDHPLGAAMLVRQAAIAATKGFDLDYRMYVEEIDWCMRMRHAGWKAYCVPRARVTHFAGQSTRQVRPQMIVALWKSRYLLFQKHYSRPYRRVAQVLIRAGMRTRIAQVRKAMERGEVGYDEGKAMIAACRQVIRM